jgi:TonB-linked SusC/RagA family outer membrane protein
MNSAFSRSNETDKRKWIMRINITTIILISTLLQVNASSFGQHVTLKQDNVPLINALQEIRKQTGYDFFYSQKMMERAKPVSLDLKNAELEDALKACFKDQPLSFTIENKMVTISKKEPTFLERVADRWASIDVRGRVVDQQGRPLPGATVKVKGKNQVTTTNENGNFGLAGVEEGSLLVVSFIGYLPKEVNASANMGNVVLEQSLSKLDEVQVIAYGTTTRRLSTGNISTISSNQIEKNVVTNPLLALQGSVPGVFVQSPQGLSGTSLNVQVRGRNSLLSTGGGTPPLYIVDGVPYTAEYTGLNLGEMSPISFLNPNDIESISILKDADATSIFGSRGSNGVILVTTKKGKAGKAQFNFQSTAEFASISRKMDLMNTQQYLEMRREAFKNDGLPIPGPRTTPSSMNYDLTLWDQNKYTDWQEELFGKIAKTNRFSASTSGGNEVVQYLIRGEYYREGNVSIGDQYNKRANFHFSLSNNSSNQKFKSTLKGTYNFTKSSRAEISYSSTGLAPNAPDMLDQFGNVNFSENASGAPSWQNPYLKVVDPFKYSIVNLQASEELSYEIVTALKFKTVLGINELRGENFTGSSLQSTPPINRSTATFGSTTFLSTICNYNVEPQLTYALSVGRGKFDFLSGISYQATHTSRTSILATGFTNENLIRNLGAATQYGLESGESEYKFFGFLTRVGYNFEEKYLFNLAFRRDGSSRFGPENQYGNFGSLGVAWIFSKEKFLSDHLPFLSFGKFNFSYGSSGNANIGDYRYLNLYRLSGAAVPYQGIKGYVVEGIANPYFGWESTKKTELNLTLGFLNDRILFNGALYQDRSTDQLTTPVLPTSVGPSLGTLYENSPAVIQNRGIELQIITDNVKSLTLKWTTSINLTINRNKLIKFPGLDSSPYAGSLFINKPFNGTAIYKSAGVNPGTGNYEFYKADGTKTTNPSYMTDRLGYRDPTPRFYGGLGSNISYRNFELDFSFQFVKQRGRELYHINPPGTFFGISNQPIKALGHWQKEGDLAKMPKYTTSLASFLALANADGSDTFEADASYIKLRNLSLVYKVPKSFCKQIGMNNVSVFFRGQNLLTFTRFKSGDPEVNQFGSNNYPTLRVLAAGINLNL